MGGLRIAARREGWREIDENTLDALVRDLRGPLLRPDAPGYDEARRIWNAMIDRRPGLIARCAGTADIAHCVRFARDHDLLVAVKGGGHNVAGNAVCDGGLMIDLSAMRGVHVDPAARRARAMGGATWADFDAETQLYGLAAPGGLISGTGVAGLTLGGGIGWLTPSYGLACDNLVSVDVVTAAGERVLASAEENAELFWGLKGGGGNFGIAASFEFQLHPVGPELLGGMLVYPLDEAEGVIARFRDFMAEVPERQAGMVGLTTLPDGTPAVALIVIYNGDTAGAERVVRPLRAAGTPLMDTVKPTPYRVLQTLFDAGAPPGLRYYWKSSFLTGLTGEAIATAANCARRRLSPKSKIFIEFLGGAFTRIPREAAVFDHRESRYNLLVIGAWDDPAQDKANRAWARETWQAMQPHASERVYVNYLGTRDDEAMNRLPAAYGPDKYERLVALKTRCDPQNLFHLNQNIPPRGAAG